MEIAAKITISFKGIMTVNLKNISKRLSAPQTSFLPKSLRRLARIDLANLPTPLEEAVRFSKAINGPNIFVKRDDLTGLASGGNKTRKLEFLIADALEQNADCIVTAGAPQSNHCRQTAAAAAHCGLECHLVIGGEPPSVPEGNYFLDQLLGAHFYWTTRSLRNKKMEEVVSALRSEGKRPYLIPIGGSNALGVMGYVAAMFEIVEQMQAASIQIDHIVFATSSGGTQAGLILGAHLSGYKGKLIGISIDQEPDEKSDYKFKTSLLENLNLAAKMLDVSREFKLEDIVIDYNYLGGGYGVVGDLERNAIRLLAKTEGILIGPVYTGRVLGALIDLVNKGSFKKSENVLFMHSGDDIVLHAHVQDFAE